MPIVMSEAMPLDDTICWPIAIDEGAGGHAARVDVFNTAVFRRGAVSAVLLRAGENLRVGGGGGVDAIDDPAAGRAAGRDQLSIRRSCVTFSFVTNPLISFVSAASPSRKC